jgi:glycosyltransferase 2 family protein
MSKRTTNWIRISISAISLAIVLATVNVPETLGLLAAADWRYSLAALAIYLLGMPVRAARWQALLAAQSTPVPLGVLTRLYFAGAFYNNLLPSGIGGDVVKMVELSQRSEDPPTAVSTVLADRALGLLVLVALAIVTLPWGWREVSPPVVLLLLALAAGSVVGIWLLLNRRLMERLQERLPPLRKIMQREKIAAFYRSLHRYRGKPLARAAAFSLLFNLMLIAVVALIGRSLGVDVSLKYYFLFVPVISTLLALPISLAGLGIREGGYIYLFTQVGVTESVALSMSLSFYAIGLITGLIGGAIYLLESLLGHRAAEEETE